MKILILFISIFYLTSCSNKINKNIEEEKTSSQILQYKSWNTIGKVSAQSSVDSGTVSLNWKQNGEQFDISLIAPFGQGSVYLIGDNSFIRIKGPKKEIEGKEVEYLLEKEVGFKIPVFNLKWWILGLPSPNSYYKRFLNNEGILNRIEQDGWSIYYRSFRLNNDNILLPHRFKIEGNDIILSVVLNSWSMKK